MIIKKKYSNVKKLINEIKNISVEDEEPKTIKNEVPNHIVNLSKTVINGGNLIVKVKGKRGEKKNPLLDTTKLLTQ